MITAAHRKILSAARQRQMYDADRFEYYVMVREHLRFLWEVVGVARPRISHDELSQYVNRAKTRSMTFRRYSAAGKELPARMSA